MHRPIWIPLCLFFGTLQTVTAATPSPEDLQFFEQKIRPVLAEHCYSCHSDKAKKVKGGLLLDSKAGWERGGDSGTPAIIPGDAAASLLIQSVRHEGDYEMPPKGKLPDSVIADLTEWVKRGAADPRTGPAAEAKRADKTWWSLQPLGKFQPEKSIDDHIQAKLQEKNLQLNPEADPRTLIRRASYDLTGLPPTAEAVDRFTTECQTQGTDRAYRQLIDQLLGSPHYGEQWGRHWMDVIRFGETNGFEKNRIWFEAWPFRDYIIDSINADKPFDRFITEHLAGDIIGKGDPKTELATAFLVCGPYDDFDNKQEKAIKEIRAVTLDDMITATSSAFLGLTVNCARCHNHKFDPIPTEDYYRIRAAFEGVKHGNRTIASKEEKAAHQKLLQPLEAKAKQTAEHRKKLEDEITALGLTELKKRSFTRPKLTYEFNEDTFPSIQARHVRFRMLSSTTNVHSAAGARVDEFEVWTAGPNSKNVALATAGGTATGKHENESEKTNSEKTYGASLTIDGGLGTRWFAAAPAVLTITLAKPETINRITFSNAREGRVEREGAQGALTVEYITEVSMDGQNWTRVASGDDRQPWSQAHGILRMRRELKLPQEINLAAAIREQQQAEAALKAVPPLRAVWAGLFEQPKDKTHVQLGGDPSRPSSQVFPSSLNVLDQITKPYALPENAPEGERRLSLAKWITSTENALTVRVLANRLWHYHFGTGIVDTPSDFGYLGSKPTHPELLEHLSHRLLQNGWKIKDLHREIMLSKTYRQASTSKIEAAKLDKDARLLWRFPPRRLSGEEVRDTLLSVTRKLDLKAGGPSFQLFSYVIDNVWTYYPLAKPGPETYRRAVYHLNVRAINLDYIGDFDFPDIAFAAPKRATTTTPMQAFTMMNHAFTLDLAGYLEEQLKPLPQAEAQVTQLHRQLLQRQPTASELQRGLEFIQNHGLLAYNRAMLNLNELLYLE
jgi:mono/diheme cytochrome c family protein